MKVKNDHMSRLKLAFVSACHSEKIAHVLQEIGVKAIVAVHSMTEINDDVAISFAKNFY